MEKEVREFIEKLKEQRTNDRKQCTFLLQHKFNREAQFYQERMKVLDEIIMPLELVLDGHKKGNEVRFYFDN